MRNLERGATAPSGATPRHVFFGVLLVMLVVVAGCGARTRARETATAEASPSAVAPAATAQPTPAPSSAATSTPAGATTSVAATPAATPVPASPTSRAPQAAAAPTPPATAAPQAAASANACTRKSMQKIGDVRYEAWNWKTGLLLTNPKDSSGNYQVHVRNLDGSQDTCITCQSHPGAPLPDRDKVMPRWSRDGKWIVMVGEMNDDPIRKSRIGFLQESALLNGWFSNLYLTTPDGQSWYQLTNYTPQNGISGTLAPHFNYNDTKLIWSRLISRPANNQGFGNWQLWEGDFTVDAQGTPSLTNVQNITPGAGQLYETSDTAPREPVILISSNIGMKNPYGLDIYSIDLATRKITNLTNTPEQWDEHAEFSPSGQKIAWMSSVPYASSGPASALSLKTEAMLMNADGSDQQQLTHFNQSGYPESSRVRAVAGRLLWSADGTRLLIQELLTGIQYPNVDTWMLTFNGACGG